ncbi:hypothetical protein [Halorarius halobius]|uniref:hypothetical protein n=1 Tax=Halorarius halobius TaxID=2962671 RepID=UPI0020CFA780|nr:hypothetical protein [Halorarius halobius]
MRFTLDDARSSPVAAAVFIVGLAAAGVALFVADGEFGAPAGTPEWWLGVAVAGVAVVVTALRLGR